jgi:peptidyl-prolyl cis-trans isomerase B (cyclophilin B)
MKTLFTALFTLLLCSTMQPSYSSTANINSTKGNKTMVKLHTNHGDITLQLDAEKAPVTVKNFLEYVNSGFYNGTIFHRVISGFMIQGGDPKGTGTGGPGYTIKAEFSKQPHTEGTVAMARSADPDSAGSQFYICLAPKPGLDRNYTVFGQLSAGLEVLHSIGSTETDSRDRPKQEQKMNKVHIEGL